MSDENLNLRPENNTEVSVLVKILDEKIDKIQKYFVWTLILTSILIVFLAVLVSVAPAHLWTYSNVIYVTVP